MVTSNAGYVTNRRDPFSRSGAVGVVEASTRFDPAVAFVIWDVPRVRFHASVRHGSAMGCCAAQSWLTAAFRPRVTAVGQKLPLEWGRTVVRPILSYNCGQNSHDTSGTTSTPMREVKAKTLRTSYGSSTRIERNSTSELASPISPVHCPLSPLCRAVAHSDKHGVDSRRFRAVTFSNYVF
jgi:hypothetical protein